MTSNAPLRFVQNARLAVVERRPNPLGTELRCSVDGAFVWGRTCFTPEELEEELVKIREDFLSRGWSLQA